ncbi:17263_t:CDS:2 [Cetraspora pellucida]|uniref:17263_t:CDS:1 n=1 Tax=Cetraspora pellucida TaxID=1433469 RepID=A0ACA9JWC7_9GLOM|nr:17263_t:CDS:2 [Cetraspora pellucida]
MLYKGKSLLETEVKKELVERLAVRMFNKAKEKAVENSNYSRVSSKKKNIRHKKREYLALERSLEKIAQTMIEKVVGQIRRSFNWEKIRKSINIGQRRNWNKNWDLIVKTKDIAATKVFILRVTNKEEWNIAAGIRDPFENDPMEAYFQKRLANARELAKNKRPRLKSKPKMNAVFAE